MRSVVIGAGVGLMAGAVLSAALSGRVVALDAVGVAVTLLVCTAVGAVVSGLGRLIAARVRNRAARVFLVLVACVPVVWVGGDLLYALLIRRGYARWEAGIEREADGVRQGCRAFTVGKGETAVLLVHGFGDSPAVYRLMAPALARKGFTCRAMRLPHFAMPMDDYKRSSAAAWRETFRDELLELARGHRRVVVVAHSLGAAVAVDYLTDQPDAVGGVVLLAPLLGVSDRRSPLLPARTWYEVLDRTLIFTDCVRSPFRPDLVDEEALAFSRADEFIPRVIYRELFSLIDRNQARAGQFRTPLLMILAEDDPVVDDRAAERFFRECASESRRLERLDGTSHVIPLDARRHSVVAEIADFVRELSSR